MKNAFFILLLSLFSQILFGQCDLLEKASEEYCSEDFASSIKTLENFKTNFPQTNITTNIDLQIGCLYLLNKEYSKSEEYLKQLLNDSLNSNFIDKKIECDFLRKHFELDSEEYDEKAYCAVGNAMVLEDSPYSFKDTKKWILVYLSRIYEETNQLEKSLEYLNEARKYYPTKFTCGNAIELDKIQKAVSYGRLYYKLDKTELALKEVLPVSLSMNYNYDEDYYVVKLSYEILKNNYSIGNIKEEMITAINNIESIESREDNGKNYISYFIRIMDLKIRVYSHIKDGDEKSKKEIETELKNSGLYKTIFS